MTLVLRNLVCSTNSVLPMGSGPQSLVRSVSVQGSSVGSVEDAGHVITQFEPAQIQRTTVLSQSNRIDTLMADNPQSAK